MNLTKHTIEYVNYTELLKKFNIVSCEDVHETISQALIENDVKWGENVVTVIQGGDLLHALNVYFNAEEDSAFAPSLSEGCDQAGLIGFLTENPDININLEA